MGFCMIERVDLLWRLSVGRGKDTGKMNKKALASRIPTDKCLDCGKHMDRGGYGTGPLGKIHYGCGGSVVGLKAIAAAKVKRHPSA